MSFSDHQIRAIEIAERVGSVLSLLGAAFIIITFLSHKSFHKPINRLVFYAAWGNIMSNVGTLLSTSGINLGVNSSLCQFQAFLIQWFMPADALWTFAMACNVYLTFFRKYDAKQLRLLEWRYVLLCYGIPFIPAFVYFFIRSDSRGRVYGSAVLWCWVSLDWDVLRVATFYGPVWLVIFGTFAIYLSAGRVVLQWRRQLLKYSEDRAREAEISNRSEPSSPGILKTTEVHITTVPAQVPNTNSQPSFDSNEAGVSSVSRSYSAPYDRNARLSITSIDANRAAVSYCKWALLFFVAALVTWVPSTVNRVVTLVHPEDKIFALNYASGLVLPLQGFWNAIIYIFTSLPACSALLQSVTGTSANSKSTKKKSRRWRDLFVMTTRPTSGNAGRGKTKQQTSYSDSIQELRGNSGDGLGRARQY